MLAPNSYTMRDVARLARVSVTTVSKVVNGKGRVGRKLTDRVEQAIAALDYHPNEVARNLKINRTATIGMVVPHVTNPFFADVFKGAEEKARPLGYSLLLCNSNEDPAVEQDLLRMLARRRVDGILLASACQSMAAPRRFPPLLCFDREPAGFTGRVVVIDNEFAGYEPGRHLTDLGHERIAIIAGPETTSTGAQRLRGFRKALREAGKPLRDDYLRNGGFSLEGGYRAGMELLGLAAPPTAVFCCNNKMTVGLMLAVRDSGLNCPQDVSVVGFDLFDWYGLVNPRLTSMIQPTYEMGQRAIESLMQSIQPQDSAQPSDTPERVVLRAELRIGESTAPIAKLQPAA
jgi:LacI family transcriptional regulator